MASDDKLPVADGLRDNEDPNTDRYENFSGAVVAADKHPIAVDGGKSIATVYDQRGGSGDWISSDCYFILRGEDDVPEASNLEDDEDEFKLR